MDEFYLFFFCFIHSAFGAAFNVYMANVCAVYVRLAYSNDVQNWMAYVGW